MYTALGAFIFAGGFTQGMRPYFDVPAVLEDGPFGNETHKLNHPRVRIYNDPAAWPLHEYGGVEVVYGNPACAPWSLCGGRGAKDDHSGLAMSTRHFELLGRLRPRVWVQESVQALAGVGKAHVAEITKAAAELGYRTTLVFEDAARLGMAQRRRRLFVVCHDRELVVDPATSKPGRPVDVLAGVREEPAVPVREEWLEKLKAVPSGTSFRNYWKRYDPDFYASLERRPYFLQCVVDREQPAPTVLGSGPNVLVHWDRERFLTANEMARLCGYPDDFSFPARPSAKVIEMTRAVMPPVAEWFARQVLATLEADVPIGPTDSGPVVLRHPSDVGGYNYVTA